MSRRDPLHDPSSPGRTFLAFVDGVGAGLRDPEINPMAHRDALLGWFLDGGRPELSRSGAGTLVDACLGVDGRPQSATGQTTILTGVNAPRAIGRHLLGFPNEPLRRILSAHSIYAGLAQAGLSPAFANAYPIGYLEAIGAGRRTTREPEPIIELPSRRIRPSASTCAAVAAGIHLRDFDDLREGLALTHDFDGSRARARGYRLPERSPEESAEILLRIGETHRFVMFEHFLLDELGHARDLEGAIRELDRYDRFLRVLIAGLRPEDHLLVVSDHGNVEDLSVRSHSRNPVPFLAFGPRAGDLVARVRSLVDVRAAVFLACGAADPSPPPESFDA